MRRKDREMPREFALQIIDSSLWAVVSMAGADGEPYGVPLSLVRDGEVLYFHAAMGGKKADLLAENARVSVCCVGYAQLVPEVYSVAYGCAIASGTAHPVTDAKEKLHALRLLAERYAKDHPERFPLEIKENFSHTAVWKIRIQEISGKRAVYPKTGLPDGSQSGGGL